MAVAHKKRVGRRIRQLREEHAWTQRELADQIPAETVDAGYVSKWERGVYYPDEHLEALAIALGTSPGDIMAGISEPDAEVSRPLSAPDPFAQAITPARLAPLEARVDLLLRILSEVYAEQVAPDLADELVQALREVELPTEAQPPSEAAS